MGRIGHCREHILDAGISVLLKKGYNGTGVKEIVDAAGVPKGSFYNHFSSKETFVVEAVEKLAGENLKFAKEIFAAKEASPKQRLFNFFHSGCQNLSTEAYQGGCLVGNLCLEMSDENTAIRETTSRIMDQYIQLFADCLVEAQAVNELPAKVNTKELAEFIHYAWEGAVMRTKGTRDCKPLNIFKNQLESFFI